MPTTTTVALATARALLQRRMTATTDSEHARAVKSLDAFMSNLQTADPDMADRIRRALYEQVTGITQSMIDSEIMPELAEVE